MLAQVHPLPLYHFILLSFFPLCISSRLRNGTPKEPSPSRAAEALKSNLITAVGKGFSKGNVFVFICVHVDMDRIKPPSLHAA